MCKVLSRVYRQSKSHFCFADTADMGVVIMEEGTAVGGTMEVMGVSHR